MEAVIEAKIERAAKEVTEAADTGTKVVTKVAAEAAKVAAEVGMKAVALDGPKAANSGRTKAVKVKNRQRVFQK